MLAVVLDVDNSHLLDLLMLTPWNIYLLLNLNVSNCEMKFFYLFGISYVSFFF